MKPLYCLIFMSALFWQGKATTTTTTTATTTETTSPLTTNDSPKNLTGKMMTLSESSSVIFNLKRDNVATRDSAGVSVCLRYLFDFDASYVLLFQLTYDTPVYFVLKDFGEYSVTFNKSEVSLPALSNSWFTVYSYTWTRVCLILDTQNNVVQVFQDTQMSIRKIPPFKMVLSGVPQLSMSGFDGQVTELQVWDHPLQYTEVSDYIMDNRGRGTLLTWSNIVFDSYGSLLVEDSYPEGNKGEDRPVMSQLEWDQYKRMLPGMGQRKRMML